MQNTKGEAYEIHKWFSLTKGVVGYPLFKTNRNSSDGGSDAHVDKAVNQLQIQSAGDTIS